MAPTNTPDDCGGVIQPDVLREPRREILYGCGAGMGGRHPLLQALRKSCEQVDSSV